MKYSKCKLYIPNKKRQAKCKWCGKTYYKEHNRQEYCSDPCRDYARLECTSRRVSRYRKKYGKKQSDWVGSGHLGEHRAEDEETELDLIQKEFKRLRLKRD